MADGITAKVTNLPDFKAQVSAFSQELQTKTFRAGTLAAGNVFKNLAIQFAPVLKTPRKNVGPGLLKRSIYIKYASDSTKGRVHYVVGARSGGGRRGTVSAFYWWFVERGHLTRGPGHALRGGNKFRALQRERLKAAGAHRVEAQPYLSKAFESGQDRALRSFINVVDKRIDQANKQK